MKRTITIKELYFVADKNFTAYTKQEYMECCHEEMYRATQRERRPVALRYVWIDGKVYRVCKGREYWQDNTVVVVEPLH